MNLKPIIKRSLTLAVISLITGGCSQHEELSYPHEEALPYGVRAMILDFHQSLHPSSRAADDIEITGIETRTYHQGDFTGELPEVRSDLKEYDITTVTFKIEDSPGYAILSDTPGIDRIFYYTESGCIGDTALIPPLKEIVETAPKMADLILSDTIHSQKQEAINNVNINPIVRFQWHQGWPYNFYAPDCSCADCNDRNIPLLAEPKMRGHRPAGCVPIAVAQAIATMKHFQGTFYGNRDIDFDSFPSTTGSFQSSVSQGMVLSLAHFIQEIGLNCQIKYGCSESSTTLHPATNYMRDIGYSVDLKVGRLDVDRFIRFQKRGNPHIMSSTNGEAGHAWILDGVKTWRGSYQYHINWGWGPNASPGWSNECYYGLWNKTFLVYHKDTLHMYILAPGT